MYTTYLAPPARGAAAQPQGLPLAAAASDAAAVAAGAAASVAAALAAPASAVLLVEPPQALSASVPAATTASAATFQFLFIRILSFLTFSVDFPGVEIGKFASFYAVRSPT